MNFYKYLSEENKARVLAKFERKRLRIQKRQSVKNRIVAFKESGVTVHSIHTAYVYVIRNAAFPEWYKIGTCVDLDKRLQTYQTSDPMKGYEIVESWITRHRHVVEREFLEYASSSTLFEVNGEWVKVGDYKKIRNKLAMLVGKSKKLVDKQN